MRMRSPRRAQITRAITLVLLLAACRPTDTQSFLYPKGEAAERVETLWWILFSLGMTVYVIVLGLLAWALLRGRRRDPDRPGDRIRDRAPANASAMLWIGVGGFLIPTLIILVVFGVTLRTLWAEGRGERGAGELTVTVIGHQWWWDFEYHSDTAERRLRVPNELYIPVGVDVRVVLETRDVLHSFWVPELRGMQDLVPGRRNVIRLRADTAGVFRGQCTEFCGMQHARMALLVVALPRPEFDAWYEQQLRPAPEPADSITRVGRDVFLSRNCALCHAVRGTPAHARAAPDLTHLASRRTLAAGTLRNNRGNLGGWISDPQSIKPGAHMPPVDLTSHELQALLSYLETLR